MENRLFFCPSGGLRTAGRSVLPLLSENHRMSSRYFSSDPISGPRVRLTGSEAHHLLHVMRAEPGPRVTLFDGSGSQFEALVESCARSHVDLSVEREQAVGRELSFRLVVGTALPKGDRQRWLVEKAVELGVARLVPLTTSHSQTQQGFTAAKLQRYVIEASKQCGRNRLMEIGPVSDWSQWLQQAEDGAARIVAHPGGKRLSAAVQPPLGSVYLCAGPEGGLSDDEIAEANSAGWHCVDLGERILRVETAVLALVAGLTLLADT